MIRKKSKLAILIHEYSVFIFDLSARPQFAPNFRCKKRGAPLPPPESDSTSQNRFKPISRSRTGPFKSGQATGGPSPRLRRCPGGRVIVAVCVLALACSRFVERRRAPLEETAGHQEDSDTGRRTMADIRRKDCFLYHLTAIDRFVSSDGIKKKDCFLHHPTARLRRCELATTRRRRLCGGGGGTQRR